MTADAKLFAAWRAGDRAAGAAITGRHYDGIVRFFRTKHPAAAEDLAQQTFLRCADGLERFRGESSFRAFIFGIARNVLRESYRAKKKGEAEVDLTLSAVADLAPGVVTHAGLREEKRTLIAALQRIPVDMQTALELHYWEGLSMEELAVVLEIPAGTVKSRLHRARQLLRDAIEQAPFSPEERVILTHQTADWLAPLDD